MAELQRALRYTAYTKSLHILIRHRNESKLKLHYNRYCGAFIKNNQTGKKVIL